MFGATGIPSMTGGAGGAASAGGGSASGTSGFNDGAFNVSFAPSLGLGMGSGTDAGMSTMMLIGLAVVAIVILRKKAS